MAVDEDCVAILEGAHVGTLCMGTQWVRNSEGDQQGIGRDVRLDRVDGSVASADSASFSCNAPHEPLVSAPVIASDLSCCASTRFSLDRLH